MKEKQIEFYGSLPEAEARPAAAMKAAGIDPAFGPAALVILAEKQRLQCPAGKSRDEVYHQY